MYSGIRVRSFSAHCAPATPARILRPGFHPGNSKISLSGEIANPLSRCSEIEPIDSKSGLCHPTKDSGGEMETENQRISEPTGISLG
jgi:hypothetical protein